MSDYLRHKVVGAPSTEAKQDTIIGYVDGVEAVLANILAKIIASPATEAKQTALNALIGEVQANPTANTLLARLKALEDKLISGISLSGSIPAGTALIGKVGIDQTTQGVTNGVSLTTALDKDIDSVDVGRMSKGGVTVAHNAITETATSAEIDCVGYNAIMLEVSISVAAKNWTFKVQGCMVSGGTFIDCYELANTGTMTLMSYQTNASKIFVFKGIPDYVKIVATEDEDNATVTVKVQPLNL